MDETRANRLAAFLAINRTVGVVLLTVLLFGLGEELWRPFLPLFLKWQTDPKEVANTGTLSMTALWTIGIYACLLNLFHGFCYIGGGQVTARLGDRGSLIVFGLLTIAGYLIFLLVPFAWATVLACVLILGWESLSMPVTFTTVGATLAKERQGIAFAIQSIQKRLPKIIGPSCAAAVLVYCTDFFGQEQGRMIGMHGLVGVALVLGVASLLVQLRYMPHRPAPAMEGNTWAILRQFPSNLRRLLMAEILTRWCDWLVRELVVVYLATQRHLSLVEIAGLVTLQHVVALLTYLPIGRMTQVVGLQPFIGLTFIFFALFPLTLMLVPDGWIWLAYVAYGLREIGEPARKAMITTNMPEAIRARGVGLYWGIRCFAVCTSALVGAWLWQVGGPELLFYTAFGMGVLGIGVFYIFCRVAPPPAVLIDEPREPS